MARRTAERQAELWDLRYQKRTLQIEMECIENEIRELKWLRKQMRKEMIMLGMEIEDLEEED